MSTSTVGVGARFNTSELIRDARTLLDNLPFKRSGQSPTINQIMEAGQKVLESRGIDFHPGILANIGDGLISMFKWESENGCKMQPNQ